jgi:type IV secretory pathway TrbD component
MTAPLTAPPAAEAHPIHQSLVRPILLAGAEPAAAILEVLSAGSLLFGVGFHVATILLAAFYLVVVHGVMVWVATQDPQMSQLYLRSLAARDFYSPHGSLRGFGIPVRPSIPCARSQ